MPSPVTASLASDAPKLGLVLTGGTIGSVLAGTPAGLLAGLAEDRGRDAPELALLAMTKHNLASAEIRVLRPLDVLSENLAPADWVRIAQAVRHLMESDRVGGVLILHGTDTMAYTAAALSFLLADVRIPIVLTGSNLPAEDPRSDAAKNLNDALVAVRALRSGTHIVFAGARNSPGWVHIGTRARKARASGRAFVSVNRQPAGKVIDGSYLPIHPLEQSRQPSRPLAVDDRVLALRLYPGLDLGAISSMIDTGAFAGVVLELYASATAPGGNARHSAPEFVRFCRERGLAVISAVPAAAAGFAYPYASTIALQRAGAVFVRDMLPETALVKLMWALAQSAGDEDVERLMLDPIAEELRS